MSNEWGRRGGWNEWRADGHPAESTQPPWQTDNRRDRGRAQSQWESTRGHAQPPWESTTCRTYNRNDTMRPCSGWSDDRNAWREVGRGPMNVASILGLGRRPIPPWRDRTPVEPKYAKNHRKGLTYQQKMAKELLSKTEVGVNGQDMSFSAALEAKTAPDHAQRKPT